MTLLLKDVLDIETFDLYSATDYLLIEYKETIEEFLEGLVSDDTEDELSSLEDSLDLVITELEARGVV